MAAWSITDADRDADGKIRVTSAPRSLSDLLPSATPAAQQPARPVSPRVLIAAICIGLLITVVLIALISRAVPDTPRPAPPAAPPSPVATPAPTAAALARSIVAFAAPDGAVLGPIDAGRAYTFVGRYGDSWLQIDAGGSTGRVWVRRADLTIDATDQERIAALPDLAPPPTPVYVAPAPAERPAPPAQATSEPQVCISTDFGRRCGPASEMQDQQRIASEIATASKEWSQSWLATATAEAKK